MGVWFSSPFVRWQDRAKPGETREHAEMRSNRSMRKQMRKQRRRASQAALSQVSSDGVGSIVSVDG